MRIALFIPAFVLAACTSVVPDPPEPTADHSENQEAGSRTTTAASDCREISASQRECTYKTVGNLALKLDVYSPGATTAASDRPLLMWIHGGALIFGSRSELPVQQRDFYLAKGFVVASIDYRLAPETKLDQIHQDVADAYAWLRANAVTKLQASADRIAIVGHSAGGYLTLTAGARLSPPPAALVSFYGYGDIRWYLTPGEQEEGCPKDGISGFPAGNPIATANDDRRFEIYGCARAKGYWPQVVGGRDPITDSAFFAQFEANKNIGATYPPSMLLHGEPDDDVPFAQSRTMANELRAKGRPVVFEQNASWGHGFDEEWSSDPSVKAAFEKVAAFLAQHLQLTR